MAAEVEKSDGILQQKQAASRVGKNRLVQLIARGG